MKKLMMATVATLALVGFADKQVYKLTMTTKAPGDQKQVTVKQEGIVIADDGAVVNSIIWDKDRKAKGNIPADRRDFMKNVSFNKIKMGAVGKEKLALGWSWDGLTGFGFGTFIKAKDGNYGVKSVNGSFAGAEAGYGTWKLALDASKTKKINQNKDLTIKDLLPRGYTED